MRKGHRIKENNLIIIGFILSILYRVLWSYFFFNFLTTDEAYYGYWVKVMLGKRDFPIMTSARHFYVPAEVLFAWAPYLLLKKIGIPDDDAVLLSLRSTGIFFSLLSSISIFFLLRIWCSRKVAFLLSMFPNITFLDWTIQARGYGLFFLSSLLIHSILKKRYALAGFLSGLSFWLVPPHFIYFFPSILFFLVKGLDLRRTILFITFFFLGDINLILYNACNFGIYKEVSRFKLTYIPTLDDIILRLMGYFEGWIHYQCGVDKYKYYININTDKLSVFLDILSFSFLNPFILISLIPYSISVLLGFVFAFLKKPDLFLIFASNAFFIYAISPQDRNMIFLLIPFIVICGIGIEELKKFKDDLVKKENLSPLTRNAVRIFLTFIPFIFPFHYILSSFFNVKDCSGYYMNFRDGIFVQVKNFSCKGKDDSEFREIFAFLKNQEIDTVFSDFIGAPIINAYFYPEILASPSLYIDIDWLPEITSFIYSRKHEVMEGKKKIAFVLTKESLRKNFVFSNIEKRLSDLGIRYSRKDLGNLVVFYDFSPTIFPDDIWHEVENKLRRCFYKSPLYFERYFLGCLGRIFSR